MNVDRLNRLIDLLQEVEESERAFNINAWVFDKTLNPDLVASGSTVGQVDEACGTVCCALGHACLDPELTAQGLHLDVRVENVDRTITSIEVRSLASYNELVLNQNLRICSVTPRFGTRCYDFTAGAQFFGITNGSSFYLFDPDSYQLDGDEDVEEDDNGFVIVTPSDVIARIKMVIACNGKIGNELEHIDGELEA